MRKRDGKMSEEIKQFQATAVWSGTFWQVTVFGVPSLSKPVAVGTNKRETRLNLVELIADALNLPTSRFEVQITWHSTGSN